MTTREPLLPCPFCGAKMALRGDYTPEAAWNFYTHEDREERDNCILSQYEIPCGPDFTTPTKSLADAWNKRALSPLGEPTEAMVEAAALAIKRFDSGDHAVLSKDGPWRKYEIDRGRAALTAAPHSMVAEERVPAPGADGPDPKMPAAGWSKP